jgi:adenylate kinase
MQPQTYIFFGPSGSGKGKQAELLMEVLKQREPEKKIIYIETGEKFRKLAEENSYTGREVNKIIDGGQLAPVFLPIWAWADSLVANFSGNEYVLFDGTPRKLEEAGILDSAIKFYNLENPVVISLEVSDEVTTERLLKRGKEKGREDDNEEEIKKRLDFYKTDVVPAINYFKNDSYYKFISIDAEKSIEVVHQDILQKVGL